MITRARLRFLVFLFFPDVPANPLWKAFEFTLITTRRYLWLYLVVLKSFLVYVSDIFSAITMLSTTSWSNQIFNNCKDIEGCVPISFDVGKWLFVGCIIFSFLLVSHAIPSECQKNILTSLPQLAYEARKSKKIIASRDISYAFTNIMANNYYSLRKSRSSSEPE